MANTPKVPQTRSTRSKSVSGQINPRNESSEHASDEELQAAAERGSVGIQSDDRKKIITASNQPATVGSVKREVDRVVKLLRSGSTPTQKAAADLIESAVEAYEEPTFDPENAGEIDT